MKRLIGLVLIIFVMFNFIPVEAYPGDVQGFNLTFQMTEGFGRVGEQGKTYLKIYNFEKLVSANKSFKGRLELRCENGVVDIDPRSIKAVDSLHDTKILSKKKDDDTVEINWDTKVNSDLDVIIFEIEFKALKEEPAFLVLEEVKIEGLEDLVQDRDFSLYSGVVHISKENPPFNNNRKIKEIYMETTALYVPIDQYRSFYAYPLGVDYGSGLLLWQSSNPKIARVNQQGMILGISKGRTTINILNLEGDILGTCDVIVGNDYVFRFKEPWLQAKKGEEYDMKSMLMVHDIDVPSSDIVWTSMDENVATVDQDGKVKIVGYGYARITAKSKSLYVEAACEFHIEPRPVAMTFEKREANLKIGEEFQVNLTLKYTDGEDGVPEVNRITWDSTNVDVAVIDEKGVITAVGPGKCWIRAQVDHYGTSPIFFVSVSSEPIDAKRNIYFNIKGNQNKISIPSGILSEDDRLNITHRGVVLRIEAQDFIDALTKAGYDKDKSYDLVFYVSDSENTGLGSMYDIRLLSEDNTIEDLSFNVDISIEYDQRKVKDVRGIFIEQYDNESKSWMAIDSSINTGEYRVMTASQGLGRFRVSRQEDKTQEDGGISYVYLVISLLLGIAARQFFGPKI